MSQSSTSIVIGGSFSNLLAIAFIVLKLTKVIDWSWWWVLSPLWIPVALVLALLVLVALLGAVFGIVGD